MKILFGTLFLTFVAFLNSIQLSSTSSFGGGDDYLPPRQSDNSIELHDFSSSSNGARYYAAHKSVELHRGSSQSSSEHTVPLPRQINQTFIYPKKPAGWKYEMPNGKYFVSRGTGIVTVYYDSNRRVATVYQGGGPPSIILPRPHTL